MLCSFYLISSEHHAISEKSPPENVLLLAKLLQEEFDSRRLSLSFSYVATEKVLLNANHDYHTLSHHLDYLTFTLLDDIERLPNNFTMRDIMNAKSISHMKQSIDNIIQMNVSSSKIVLGLPFGGTEFRNLDGSPNTFQLINNNLGYNVLCPSLSTVVYDVETSLAISRTEHRATGEICVFVYDNRRSINNKVTFALDRSLAGVRINLISMDDINGECEMDQETFVHFNPLKNITVFVPERERNDNTFPLLRTIDDVFSINSPIGIADVYGSGNSVASNAKFMLIIMLVILRCI